MRQSFLLVAVALLALAIAGCASGGPESSGSPSPSSPAAAAPAERAVTITATDLTPTSPYKFTPATLSGKVGETLNVTLKSPGGTGGNQQPHDFVISELNVKSKQIPAGQSTNVVVALSKAGSFSYFCSVGNHRQLGMQGTLTVS